MGDREFKQLGGDADWWRGGVIYQIYPRSFQDSNNDGIGDLRGIISRLDHVKGLGVDAIWISPFFTSPMKDFGYDVSDYRDIDPMFGDMEDFDDLIREAHERDLRVMIDLVLSHSSDQHPWFMESRQNRDNSRADWYVWADPKPDGSPPNNWLSIFGGSAWQWEPRRMQYYLHNFLAEQPDFNFHNEEVQAALLDITRFWLDRGVDGFRLDTINFYVHDKKLRDNPALADDRRDASTAPSVNPYNYQDHLYSKNQPENLEFIEKFRALLDEYPATTSLGEIGDGQYGLDLMGEYTKGDKRAHMCYAFEFLSGDALTPKMVEDILGDFAARAGAGNAAWAFSNHDVVRHASRWGLDEAGNRMAIALMAALPGAMCIYQGEEYGFDEADIAFDDLQDPYGKNFWPEFKGRDGCRTPMPWDPELAYAGFSDHQSWLPIWAGHVEKLAGERARNDGLLAHYRDMIKLRKQEAALQRGEYAVERFADKGLLIKRSLKDETVLSLFNFAQEPQTFEVKGGSQYALIAGGGSSGEEGLIVNANSAAFFKAR